MDLTFITSATHRSIVTEILEEARRDDEMIGLFLQGSVARGDCYASSDLDLYAVQKTGLSRPFHSEYRKGILVEIKYADIERATGKCKDAPMGLYNFLDSIILLDSEGKLKQLKELAQALINQYRTPQSELESLEYWLKSSLIKIKAAKEAEDELKASFIVSTTSWKIVEGIWAVNNRPVPPSGSVLYYLRYLDRGPENMGNMIKVLFAGDVKDRIDKAIEMIEWIIVNLKK